VISFLANNETRLAVAFFAAILTVLLQVTS
jgi:hypothetical protein